MKGRSIVILFVIPNNGLSKNISHFTMKQLNQSALAHEMSQIYSCLKNVLLYNL